MFDTALAELKAGRKRTHWMWFVFPQLRGLGQSSTARFFGIDLLEEARAYHAHPVLGPRLARCTEAVIACDAASLHAIFGSPDDLKFRSSMTLFEAATSDSRFAEALERWCAGERDPATVRLLAGA